MYICSCNALTDADVAEAIKEGAHRPAEIYRRRGCCAQCGGCVRTMLECLRAGDCQGGTRS
ncbi:(2Fe-2S)-binding protein [Rhodovastum atsumiense]|uniref:Bacterioferritin-associated ferredoxin n=1 Tax=Rhodovastum atsumiense TaxID=504468 RepID=A0A5M6IPE3_9PROT|nr:(2Fe-2S)-binding protein [Rhodovastum atsumiense]KAA5609438.1 (2Fe-2S)-binding protein [Rhodovastum atsumiense]CAH2603516.1 (2Fe-2S)-binding protein [Rhodovastum atsumiense]